MGIGTAQAALQVFDMVYCGLVRFRWFVEVFELQISAR